MAETWRPIVSGLIGGLVAMGLMYLLRDQVPRTFKGRDVAALIKRYRSHIRFVDTTFVAALFAGVFVYKSNWVASNDWRPLALTFGGGAIVPFFSVYVSLRTRDRSAFEDFMVAIAANDGYPLWALNWTLAFCAGVLAAGLGGYVLG